MTETFLIHDSLGKSNSHYSETMCSYVKVFLIHVTLGKFWFQLFRGHVHDAFAKNLFPVIPKPCVTLWRSLLVQDTFGKICIQLFRNPEAMWSRLWTLSETCGAFEWDGERCNSFWQRSVLSYPESVRSWCTDSLLPNRPSFRLPCHTELGNKMNATNRRIRLQTRAEIAWTTKRYNVFLAM